MVRRLAGVLVAVVLSTWFAAGAAAAPFGLSDETAQTLVDELEGRYDVIVLSRGYAVRPLEPDSGLEVVEVEDGGVIVDGERLGVDALRDLLGDDADVLFALAGDDGALARFEARRDGRLEDPDAAARELEESIRRQVEELERLDSERLDQLGETLERERRRPRRFSHSETRVSLGSSLTIEENESARDVVVILGPLTVKGETRGDTVVVLGSAEIEGRVEGDLTVVGGNVSLGPDAVVEGDLNCVGGKVDRAPGAEVDGQISEVSMAPFSLDLPGFEFDGWSPFDGWYGGSRWLELVGTLFNTVFLTVLVLLTVLVARQRVGSVADRARAEPWKSGLIGFVVEVLIAPVLMLVSLLLVISIVGIPVLMVLLPLSFLVLVALLFLGYAGVATALGRSIRGRGFDPRAWSPFLVVLIGLALIQIWHIAGQGLALAPGVIRFSGILLIVFGFFLKYLVWTVGLGAVMLDRFSPLPAEEPFLPPEEPQVWEEEMAQALAAPSSAATSDESDTSDSSTP